MTPKSNRRSCMLRQCEKGEEQNEYGDCVDSDDTNYLNLNDKQ